MIERNYVLIFKYRLYELPIYQTNLTLTNHKLYQASAAKAATSGHDNHGDTSF